MDEQQIRNFVAGYKPLSERGKALFTQLSGKLDKIIRLLDDEYSAPRNQEELNPRALKLQQDFTTLRLQILEAAQPFAVDPFEPGVGGGLVVENENN